MILPSKETGDIPESIAPGILQKLAPEGVSSEDIACIQDHLWTWGRKMDEGTLFYKEGTIRFVGSYITNEDGTEDYIEGSLFREDGKLWMEGSFQRGGLRKGKQYYPSGELMFSGEYNDRETGSYYGPPYPVVGTLYDEAGNILYTDHIPHRGRGSLAYPYIPLPDGKEMAINGISDDHAGYKQIREEHFRRTADFGKLPTYEEYRSAVAKSYREYMRGQDLPAAEHFLCCEETQKMILESYKSKCKAWEEKLVTEKMIMHGSVDSLAYCLFMMFE